MKTTQLKHTEIENKQHELDIILMAEDLSSPANYGMMIRTAEAFGISKVIFISKENIALTPKMKRSSRSAEKYVQVEFKQDAVSILNRLKSNDYQIVALEKTNNSISINQFKTDSNKMVLIAGNENLGVSEQLLSLSNASVHIDMFGQNSSMNVVVATGIALNGLVNL